MLRNWSERIPAGSPAAGALVSGTPYVGRLGSEILAATAEGTHGAGLVWPWTPEPNNRYRALTHSVTGGPLNVDELGAGGGVPPFSALVDAYEYVAGSTAAPNVWADVPLTGQAGPPLAADSSLALSMAASAAASVLAAASSSAALALQGAAAAAAVVAAESAVGLALAGSALASVGSVRGSLARVSMSARSLRVTHVS